MKGLILLCSIVALVTAGCVYYPYPANDYYAGTGYYSSYYPYYSYPYWYPNVNLYFSTGHSYYGHGFAGRWR